MTKLKLKTLKGEEAKQAITDWYIMPVMDFAKKYNYDKIIVLKTNKIINELKEKVKNEEKDEKKEDYKTMTYADLIKILNKELKLNIKDIKVKGEWIEDLEEETFKLSYEVTT